MNIRRFCKEKQNFIIVFISLILFLGLVEYISYHFLHMMQINMEHRMESSRVYEQWLLTKASAEIFLTSNKKPELKTNVNINIKVMDNIFSNLETESAGSLFNTQALRKKLPEFIQEWHYIKYYLLEIVSNENSYRNFESQIFWLANDTNSFDNDLKNITVYLEQYHSRQLKVMWMIFVALAVVCACVSGGFIFYMNKLVKARQSEREYKKLLAESMENRESEKRDMVLEIHDTVIQDMVFSKMLCMDLISHQTDAGAQENLKLLTNRIVSALQQIRDISYGIRPPEMDKKLEEILESYITNWMAKTGRNVDFVCIGLESVKIQKSLKLNIYRIIQELLTNIEKHSDARNVRLNIIVSWPSLIMKFSDDGSGFDFQNAMEISDGKSHSGLRGMMERVRISRGVIKIKSLKDKGTSVNINFPLEDHDE